MSQTKEHIICLAGEPYEYQKGEGALSDRVTLTSYNLADAPEIFALIRRNSDFFTQYDHDWTTKPKYQNLAQFAETIRNPEDPNTHHFFIRNAQGEAVGGCRIAVDKDDKKSAEIGYFIDQAQTHKRYASQTVGLLVGYAEKVLKLHKLSAYVKPENIGSVTTLERSGFTFAGRDVDDLSYHWYERALPTPES